MLIKFIFLMVSLLLTHSTCFSSTIGRVIKVKGNSTMLLPGERDASIIKKGQAIKQDTSILTKDKSVVIVLFKDKTKMVIGPKSKIIVKKFTQKNQGIVSLLKGKLRANIQKEKNEKLKFFVKSKSAALGVRGTSFQTTYNPENNLTSLLTFTGEVAMVNAKKVAPKIEKATSKIKGSEPKIADIEKELTSKKAVSVKAGNYSGVSSNLKKATAPVKIAPVQFARIKLSKTFGVDQKTLDQKEIKKEIEKIKKKFSEDKTDKESEDLHINPDTGEYHPRSGGLVDIETGVYIPPTEDSTYDKKLKIFKSKGNIGSISKTGDYIPPKGVILTASNGFVAKDKSKSQEAQKVLKTLNRQIKGQVKKVKPIKYSLDDLGNEDVYDRYFED